MSESSSFSPPSLVMATIGLSLATFMQVLDTTIANVALPTISGNLGVSSEQGTWVITSFAVSNAIALPLTGWLARRVGEVRLFIAATLLFVLASFLCGIAQSMPSLVGFRALQGFVAGPLYPITQTLLISIYPPAKRGMALALLAMVTVVAPIAGPILGGWITDDYSWPWIFFINVFIVLIAAPLMMKTIPDFEPFNKDRKLDIFGIINLSLMSAALIYGITKAADHASFNNIDTILWAGIGLVSAAIYLVYNLIRKNQTVLPMNLFAHKSFTASAIGLFLANIAIMGPMLILPLFFQNFRHFTAIEAALSLIPQGVGMLVTRPLIGKMIDKIGAKYVVMVSLVLSLIGSVPLIYITDKTSLIWISVVLFIRGASFGGIMLPLTSDAYTGLDGKQLPEAGVGINMIENLGSSFGSAVIATVTATVIQGLQPTIENSLKGYHAGFLVSVIILAVIFIPSLFLTHKKTAI